MANVTIPKGMLEAALDAPIDEARESQTYAVLEAALRWLSENPIVPTDAQIEEMKIKLVPVHPHWSNIVAEWQRRMFLAPDGPDVSQWTCQLSGYTFTQEEADAICEYVRTASHPIRAGFNGEPVASNVEFTNALKAVQGEAPEPEVPEAIKDLLYRTRDVATPHMLVSCAETEERVIEAYRRGQQSKEGSK